ncbi:MAG: tRNA (N(6)-L-threonylcarbamoyladenosine(37)-C(2))-methylthiotransferase MtaB [Candidatus Howiella sp.]|jgi:threonylcarbamoyladenosine tRNA methylthiotransferase MtaB
MKVLFITLGCKVNQYETEAIRERFEAAGYIPAAEGEEADAVIINSCTVTAESDRKTRQICRKYRRRFPTAAIVLIGCMAQAFPEEAEALDCADVILGNRDAGLVLRRTEEYLADRIRRVEVAPHDKTERFNTPGIGRFEERTRAFMKIEDGCQRYCTYCIIPTARGVVRSRPVAQIREEAVRLSSAGYREIVLVGINLSAYGKDSGERLCDAVSAVCGVEGIGRVRLGSLEPDQITDDDLARLAAEEKFCPQFHLSLQSGCDATLKRMNRHYGTAFYTDLVTRIRRVFPNPSITTDIMVGFPGESEADFLASVEYLKEIGFARSHVFAYSRRAGTRAAVMPDQIPKLEKARRAGVMAAAADGAARRFYEAQVGLRVKVLFEQFADGLLSGYSENYTHILTPGDRSLCGEIRSVEITGVLADGCAGRLSDDREE